MLNLLVKIQILTLNLLNEEGTEAIWWWEIVTSQRSYRIPGRSHSSGIRALNFGKLGTSKCREQHDKPLTLTCSKVVEWKDVCSFSPVRTPKLQLAAKQPSTGECWIPPKNIPHVQGQRRSPCRAVGGAKSCLESNPIPTRDALRAQTKPCTEQETPQRRSQICLWVSVPCRGMGQQWPAAGAGALGTADRSVA